MQIPDGPLPVVLSTAPSTPQGDELIKLAQDRFFPLLPPDKRKLSAAEEKMLRAAAEGTVAYCGPSPCNDDPRNDPSKSEAPEPEGWGRDRTIRAELTRWLCVDRKAKGLVDPKGIQVHAARVSGKLDLSFVIVPFPLSLDHCRLAEAADLSSAEIPALYLHGTRTLAITADDINTRGDMFLHKGFAAEGKVRLLSAQIGGNLECDGGTFRNPLQKNERGEVVPGTGTALDADRVNVEGSVFLSRGFTAEGEVRLLGAQIGSVLSCIGGRFRNPLQKDARGEILAGTGDALSADGIEVSGNVFLCRGFAAEGKVRLPGAQIGGELDCSGGMFGKVTAQGAVIKGRVLWQEIGNARGASLDLRNASAGSLADDQKSWPAQGNLLLDGFTYGRISAGPTDAESRLKWLGLQPEKPLRPQPYRQLAKVLRELGDHNGAALVLEEMERRRRRETDRTLSARFSSWVLDESIRYGYDSIRAIWAIGIVWAVGWIIYRRAYLAGNFVPTERDACESFNTGGGLPPNYQALFPSIYSLENSLPLVNLGQASRWHPDQPRPDRSAQDLLATQRRKSIARGARQPNWPALLDWVRRGLVLVGLLPRTDGASPPPRAAHFATSPRILWWFLWAQILLGWLLATLFVAGVTGLVRPG